MTTIRRLIAAATLISTTALAPGLAAADERQERDWREDRRQDAPRPERRDREQEERFERRLQAASPGWRGHEQDRRFERRERLERARLVRLELYELERDRAEARVRLAGRPWELASYQAWYLARRDRLSLQLQQLSWFAWR
jgi:hypothetical protein